jgi:hypothetical protein
MLSHGRTYGTVLLVVALMLVGSGLASAHGGDTSLIHSCVNAGGRIRIVGATSSCLGDEQSLDWNKQGPAGPSSLSVVLRESSRLLTLAPGEGDFVTSPCLDGEVVVGGGVTNSSGFATLGSSGPFFDGTHSGWTVRFDNKSAETLTFIPSVGAECVPGSMSAG